MLLVGRTWPRARAPYCICRQRAIVRNQLTAHQEPGRLRNRSSAPPRRAIGNTLL